MYLLSKNKFLTVRPETETEKNSSLYLVRRSELQRPQQVYIPTVDDFLLLIFLNRLQAFQALKKNRQIKSKGKDTLKLFYLLKFNF